jgi:hypothetical protein
MFLGVHQLGLFFFHFIQYQKKSEELEAKISFLLERSSPDDDKKNLSEEEVSFKYKFFSSALLWEDREQQNWSDNWVAAIQQTYTTEPPLPSHFQILFYFPSLLSKSIRCDGNWTVSMAIHELFRFTHMSFLTKGSLPNDYFVRYCGTLEFLDLDTPLNHFVQLREYLKKNLQIELVLVEKTEKLASQLEIAKNKVSGARRRIFFFLFSF